MYHAHRRLIGPRGFQDTPITLLIHSIDKGKVILYIHERISNDE